MLDLSAPKFLIPDHFENKNAALIVIDFGKLVLSNRNAFELDTNNSSGRTKCAEVNATEDDEDLFLTPARSPGEETEEKFIFPDKREEIIANAERQFLDEPGNTEAVLYSKMYDKYALDFNNMQIIVGQVKDNWKGAHLKGNSSLHVVDRFSISLQVERRTVETADPAWPSIIISATLPRLQLHFNEEKVVTLKHMVARLVGPDYGGRKEAMTQTVEVDLVDSDQSDDSLALIGSWQPSSGADVSSKLVVAHFCVSDLSVEVQSQGKPVAEVQVINMKAGVTRRPYDTNLAMSVHSLLLVDALQTFGPDYELLVASHKHVTVDSVSGSLRGSDPASPASPGSPGQSSSPPPS